MKMPNLLRISLEYREELDNSPNIEKLGQVFVSINQFNSREIVINSAKEQRKFFADKELKHLSKNDLLKIIDKYLLANNLYITDADFFSQRFNGLVPPALCGYLYAVKNIGITSQTSRACERRNPH